MVNGQKIMMKGQKSLFLGQIHLSSGERVRSSSVFGLICTLL